MNPALEAALAIGTLAAAIALLWLLDWLTGHWRHQRAATAEALGAAREFINVQPREDRVAPVRQYTGPSAADHVPYDSGPVIRAPREEA